MTELADVLRDIATTLGREGVHVAVVGGLAVSVRGTARFTADADLAVAVGSDREAERLTGRLLGAGYQIVAQLEHRDEGRFGE